jgi:hypothetical protein
MSSVTVPTTCFLATDFNTGTITVSLNYTLQIPWHYSTGKVFSSQPNSFLHNWTANPELTLSIPQSLEPAWVSCYIAPGWTQRKTSALNSNSTVGPCGNVFTEQLPSNACFFSWLLHSTVIHATIFIYLFLLSVILKVDRLCPVIDFHSIYIWPLLEFYLIVSAILFLRLWFYGLWPLYYGCP